MCVRRALNGSIWLRIFFNIDQKQKYAHNARLYPTTRSSMAYRQVTLLIHVCRIQTEQHSLHIKRNGLVFIFKKYLHHCQTYYKSPLLNTISGYTYVHTCVFLRFIVTIRRCSMPVTKMTLRKVAFLCIMLTCEAGKPTNRLSFRYNVYSLTVNRRL